MSSLLQNTVFGKKKSLRDNELIAYYNFDNNTTEVTGKSPNGLGTNISYTAGKLSSAINFPLSNLAHVDIPNNSNFSFTLGNGSDVPFSISLWIYVTHFSSVGNWLVNKRGPDTNVEWQVRLTPEGAVTLNKFSEGSNTVYQSAVTSNGVIHLNNWYHIVVADNGSKTVAGIYIYVNSINQSTNDTSIGQYLGMNIGTNIIRIGANSWLTPNNTLKHTGYIDELSIWKNRVLNQNEVNKLYNSGNGISFPF